MTVTSGLKCIELSGKSLPLGCLSKKLLGSSKWHSTRRYLTWRTQDTPANHLLFRLAASMPRTFAKDCVLWPTPSTGAALCGGTGNFKTLKAMQEAGIISEEERRQLSQGNGGKTNPEMIEWLMGYERKFTEDLIPTPISTDYNGGSSYRAWMPDGWTCSQSVHVEREREREREAQAIRRSASEPDRDHALGETGADERGIHRMDDGIPDWLYSAEHFWDDGEPEDLPRVKDGVPNRVDRIKALGNAIPPQQFYPFYAAIMDEIRKEESV